MVYSLACFLFYHLPWRHQWRHQGGRARDSIFSNSVSSKALHSFSSTPATLSSAPDSEALRRREEADRERFAQQQQQQQQQQQEEALRRREEADRERFAAASRGSSQPTSRSSKVQEGDTSLSKITKVKLCVSRLICNTYY